MIRTSGPVPREFKHRALPLSVPCARSQTVTLPAEEVALLKQDIYQSCSPSASSPSKGICLDYTMTGKDNAMPMAAPGHHSYTWPFHKPTRNLCWAAAENVGMRGQQFQAKPREGITTSLAQRDPYASRNNSFITWAHALFASNAFLWRYPGMGSSQHISVAAEQT